MKVQERYNNGFLRFIRIRKWFLGRVAIEKWGEFGSSNLICRNPTKRKFPVICYNVSDIKVTLIVRTMLFWNAK